MTNPLLKAEETLYQVTTWFEIGGTLQIVAGCILAFIAIKYLYKKIQSLFVIVLSVGVYLFVKGLLDWSALQAILETFKATINFQ